MYDAADDGVGGKICTGAGSGFGTAGRGAFKGASISTGVDMRVNIGALRLKNPVLAASGTFGFGREYHRLFDIQTLGGIMVKGLTLQPRSGNPPPRMAETPSGMLNSVGLQNPGVDSFIACELPWLDSLDIAVFANISGNTVEEYAEMARRLDAACFSGMAYGLPAPSILAIEVNVSCPNVKCGGMAFGTDSAMVAKVTRAVRANTRLPVVVKLSPNVTDIAEMACAAEAEGADAVSLINTLLGMDIDIRRKRPVFANTYAGLSGPAVMPVALRMVWQTYRAVKIPIIGMGGIGGWEDAARFILAGASAVAIGTAGLASPSVWWQTVDGLARYAAEEGFGNISKLVGLAHST